MITEGLIQKKTAAKYELNQQTHRMDGSMAFRPYQY